MTNDARRVPRGLYAVTPESRDTDWLVQRVRECLEGGAALVQYRAKNASAELALEQARRIAAACRAAGVPLVVNDSVELTLAVDAAGVHVGREDLSVAEARRRLPGRIVGASCYDDPRLAAAAAQAGADYVAIGSVFASPTKPGARRASLDLIAEANRVSRLPVAAIGGITLENAPRVVAAGADLLAIISAVFEAPDPRDSARAFARIFTDAVPVAHAHAQPRAV